LDAVKSIIRDAQGALKDRLEGLAAAKGIQKDMYIKYLSMQYHLTKDVQSHFYRIAGHSTLVNRKSLREFLVKFADEEAPHYAIAEKDLKHLGVSPLAVPMDVELWRAYFLSVLDHNPFIRLGATCILENITQDSGEIIRSLIKRSDYLEPRNLMFLTIHMHGAQLPHGDQILAALADVTLTASEVQDLEKGATYGAAMFLRMLDWALS
jgi:hypothetical protein